MNISQRLFHCRRIWRCLNSFLGYLELSKCLVVLTDLVEMFSILIHPCSLATEGIEILGGLERDKIIEDHVSGVEMPAYTERHVI
jgi:hypothetical protein